MDHLSEVSIWSLFLASGIVVKSILCLLFFCMILTWTICLVKFIELFLLRRRLLKDLRQFRKGDDLFQASERVAGRNGVMRIFFDAALDEWRQSVSLLADQDGVKERVALCLERAEAASARQVMTGTGFLAIIGSTAPFVGLLGTVWGIMNSFMGIAKLHTSNLAVVAPGIAEALLATSCGLLVAIPASVAYNLFSRQIHAYKAMLADAGTFVIRLVSRDLSMLNGPPVETLKPKLRMAAE